MDDEEYEPPSSTFTTATIVTIAPAPAATPASCFYNNPHMLDPLTTIIKLALLYYKPPGTKIHFGKNKMDFHEPGLFQGLCRQFLHSTKDDIRLLYNPIKCACLQYLTPKWNAEHPNISKWFVAAQHGLLRSIDTYSFCPLMRLSLTMYHALISCHLEKLHGRIDSHVDLFIGDDMTPLYHDAWLKSANNAWDAGTIAILLNLVDKINDENARTLIHTAVCGVDQKLQIELFNA